MQGRRVVVPSQSNNWRGAVPLARAQGNGCANAPPCADVRCLDLSYGCFLATGRRTARLAKRQTRERLYLSDQIRSGRLRMRGRRTRHFQPTSAPPSPRASGPCPRLDLSPDPVPPDADDLQPRLPHVILRAAVDLGAHQASHDRCKQVEESAQHRVLRPALSCRLASALARASWPRCRSRRDQRLAGNAPGSVPCRFPPRAPCLAHRRGRGGGARCLPSSPWALP